MRTSVQHLVAAVLLFSGFLATFSITTAAAPPCWDDSECGSHQYCLLKWPNGTIGHCVAQHVIKRSKQAHSVPRAVCLDLKGYGQCMGEYECDGAPYECESYCWAHYCRRSR